MVIDLTLGVAPLAGMVGVLYILLRTYDVAKEKRKKIIGWSLVVIVSFTIFTLFVKTVAF